jgi:hypothetical protein
MAIEAAGGAVPALEYNVDSETIGPLSSGRPTSRLPHIRLELGRWTTQALNNAIQRVNRGHLEASSRAAAWATLLVGTPSKAESSLSELGRHEFRVRLSSLDCITLAYTCIALARAHDFTSFVSELVKVRYADVKRLGVDNDPDEGNFLDFACESLLTCAIDRNVLRNMTEVVAEETTRTILLTTELKLHRRQKWLCPSEKFVRPYFGQREFSARFIPAPLFNDPRILESLKSGDLILTTRGGDMPTLVHHCLFVDKIGGGVSFIHCSLNGYYFSDENAELIRREGPQAPMMCGICKATEYAGDDHIIRLESRQLFPYRCKPRRRLGEFLCDTFKGGIVLRVS